MPNNKTENYLRLHLLNNEAVGALRETFLKIIRNTSNGDVDHFLKEFEEDIKTMHKLSYVQRKILFPDNGRTNVDSWDMTLLSFILINCCSLDGKICISKLRELMKKQISAFTDITSFLAYNKDRIDQMRGEGVIDDTQYINLFPKNSSNESNLNDWDIYMLLSMLVAFSSGQNKVKLYNMLQNCVARDIRLHCLNPSLTDYLTRKQSECKTILQNGRISRHEYSQLFPKDGVISDFNNWDKHLVEVFVTNICVGLGKDTIKAVSVIRQIRNEMLAHKGTAEMETGDFLITWTNLKQAIEEIIKQEVPDMMQEWIKKHTELHSGPFDISGAINILKTYYCKETSEFNSMLGFIEDIKHKIEVANKLREAEYKLGQQQRDKLITINKDLAEKVQHLVDRDKSKEVYTEAIEADLIDITIHVASRDEHLKQQTENAIRLAIQKILKGNPTEIKIQTVKKLVEGVTRDGTEIVDVQSGSVLLKVKCISLKGITNLLVLTESEELRKEMEDELVKTIDEDIRLECGITEESKQTIIDDLDRIKTEYETKKPLVIRYDDSDLLIQDAADIAPSDCEEASTSDTPSESLLVEALTCVVTSTSSLNTPLTATNKQQRKLKRKSTSAAGLKKIKNSGCDKRRNRSEKEDPKKKEVQALKRQSVRNLANKLTYTIHDGPALVSKQEPSVKKKKAKVVNEDEIKLEIGEVVEILKQVPHAEKIQTFTIESPEDNNDCYISSCTVLPTGDIMVCDHQNKNVKLFDKHYTYRSVLHLLDRPKDSCLSLKDNTEVFVTAPYSKTIYRIKVGDIMEVKGHILGYVCSGITCCMVGIAAVVLDINGVGYIEMLQYDGTYIRRLHASIRLKMITSIMNGRELVIADTDSSRVMSLDIDIGETVFEYTYKDLTYPTNVTSDYQDNIYLVEGFSGKVVMLSSTGEKCSVILTHSDGLNYPCCLEYNRYNDTIILQPDDDKNEMCVYKISK